MGENMKEIKVGQVWLLKGQTHAPVMVNEADQWVEYRWFENGEECFDNCRSNHFIYHFDFVADSMSEEDFKNLKGEKFRIRAPTINIGGVSVPKPLTEPPENETLCYMPSLASSDLYYIVYFDGNAKSCKRWLKMGIIHPTKDAAVAHAKALIAISGGAV